MSARDFEDDLLARCVAVARGELECASNQVEANVFEVAGLILQSKFPVTAEKLIVAAGIYFVGYPDQKLKVVEVVRKQWIYELSRFRNRLMRLLIYSGVSQ
ncbi:MAG: hypothetical protein RIB30_17245 [Thalassospira sp.]|uniref:hypothetical protein n=1 Tax=Thalassospira sp. TaxID=1912094 RepID=UPI0032EF7303